MRCPRCGNENQETNRFCGMCGATLLPAAAPVAPQPAAAPAAPAPPATRPAAPVSQPGPVISGPSFLGLNQPAPAAEPRRASFSRDSLSIDPKSAPSSRSLDYLLEDEEEPRRGGAGKFFLIVLALALAVGFGYLRWKNQGFGWLNSKP